MKLSVLSRMILLVAVTGVLMACHGAFEAPLSTGATTSVAPTNGQQVRSNFGDNKAQLYVYLGRVHGQVFSHRNWRAARFSINGVDVGLVSQERCLHFELEPGVYSFGWRLDESTLGPVKTAADYDNLLPNQTVYLALNIERNMGALLGPIGWWADPDRGHLADTFPRAPIAVSCKTQSASAVMAKLHPIAGPTTDLPPSW